MAKIVLNKCFGGFGLSEKAYAALGMKWDGYGHGSELKRDDPDLVRVVEELGDEASGFCAKLRVVSIPDGIAWEIDDYDGQERVLRADAQLD